MNIRRAEEKDMSRIDELLYQVYQVHHQGRPDLFDGSGRKYTDEQLREILKDDTRPIFVAVDEQDVVQGYCFCIYEQILNDTIRTPVKTLYIDDLCIDETKRGQHIGSALYAYVREYAKKNGFYNLTLNVWACNTNAQKFYAACGMKPQRMEMETIL